MNYGYSTQGRPMVVHKTKTSVGGMKKFLPECKKGEITGYVVTGEELTLRCNKKGLKVKQCDKCFGWFGGW